MNKRFLAISIFVVGLGVFLSYIGSVGAQDQATEAPALDPQEGVWNDGQAAIWDLNILDHFRIFAAEERAKGYAPEQPVKFSHVTHVKKSGLNCQFCHWNVAKSPYASIPEVQTCNGCHGAIPGLAPQGMVQGSTDVQKQDLEKLREYIASGEPIPWEKVHVMPDHVRFNHKRHVRAGVTCQECHGQVPEMEVVERVSSMKMGWCVDCHRQRGTSIDCYTCHK